MRALLWIAFQRVPGVWTPTPQIISNQHFDARFSFARVIILAMPVKMADLSDRKALEDLLELMRDRKIGLRPRLRAGIAAIRLERAIPGAPLPEAARFLREVLDMEISGTRLEPELRIEAGGALGFFEKRCAAALLRLGVPDLDERQRELMRRRNNAHLRLELIAQGRWPQDAHLMAGPNEPYEELELDNDTG